MKSSVSEPGPIVSGVGNSSAPDKATLCGFTYRMKTGRPCQLAMPRGKYLLIKGVTSLVGSSSKLKTTAKSTRKGKKQ